jgi:TolB-like protein
LPIEILKQVQNDNYQASALAVMLNLFQHLFENQRGSNLSANLAGYLRVKLFKKFIIISILFTLFICYGCAGKGTPSFYINQNIDFGFIKRVAVLPLDNLTNEKFAGDSVRQVVISELLASGLVEVVVPGDAITALEKLRLKPGQQLSAQDIKAVGKSLNVQAVVLGSVNKYGEIRSGNISAPEVSITLMMADTNSGIIIWSVTETRGGASFWARHFGAQSETISETVLKVVRKALQTLYNY